MLWIRVVTNTPQLFPLTRTVKSIDIVHITFSTKISVSSTQKNPSSNQYITNLGTHYFFASKIVHFKNGFAMLSIVGAITIVLRALIVEEEGL